MGDLMLKLIPAPKHAVETGGFYSLPDDVKIKTDFDLPLVAEKVQTVENGADIVIINDADIEKEGYTLSVTESSVTVKASTKTGAYYALVSLWKLGELQLGNREIPCCEIEDGPKVSWRGLEIDESRHFFGMDEIKRMLDMMFLEKLNVFHWHLTDDQGWRIEIKKYPKLIEIGSKRPNSQIGGWRSVKMDNIPVSGYYTQEQIKEVITYAKERGIMIVPEIDFPAHCAAAIAAYKELACVVKDTEVPCYFGGRVPQRKFNFRWNRTVCCGKESTFEFIFNVLDEVCDLFDSPYIHMGGDEAPQIEWKKCPKCQKTMADNSLKNEWELQGWFENRICDYLKTKNKKLIAWNDVLKADNLNKDDKNVVVQYWTPKRDDRCVDYVNSGGEAILSNHQAFYFDMSYAQVPLTNTYNYTPEKYGMNSGNMSNVLGYEGELWTEWIADNAKLELYAFPRMQALGEVSWSAKEKINFDDFKARLDAYKPTLKSLGIDYAVDSVSFPQSKRDIVKIKRKFYKGDPYLELKLNEIYKSKGEN